MGMAASQGRLLGLTARISDVEFSSQQILQQKIMLSMSAEQVSNEYTAALNKQKLTVFSGMGPDGSASYIDASAANLTGYNTISSIDKQRFIKNSAGQVVVSEATERAYNNAASGTWRPLTKTYDEYKAMTSDQIRLDGTFVEFLVGMSPEFQDIKKDMPASQAWPAYQKWSAQMDPAKMAYYQNQFCEIVKSGGCVAPGDENLNSPEWLEQQVDAGNLRLYVPDTSSNPLNGVRDYSAVSWQTGDTSLQEVRDTEDLDAAEARYNAEMASIQRKDKIFDMNLKQLDTEHNALQTEVDSVKKVIDKNIESSFKTFG